MSSLYELTADYQAVLEMMEDPEVDPQTISDTLEGLDGEIEEKADGYAMVIRQLEADASVIKAEEKRLLNRRKTIESNIDRMKKALQAAMQVTGKPKFKTALFSFNIAKNGGALPLIYSEDFNAEALPEGLQNWSVEPNTEAIRKALTAGENVPGVVLGERGESLRIK